MIPWHNLPRFFYKTLTQPAYALRVLGKRLTGHYYYSFGNGLSAPPEALTLFLTHRCNLHCAMCGQWGEGGVTKSEGAQFVGEELPIETLRQLIDEVTTFKPSITLFGGEPLLYPGCMDLIRYLKDKKLHGLMITNGSLLENIAGDLVKSGLDELNVSLDGKGDLHDQIRGLPGLFGKIMAGLQQLKACKLKLGTVKPFINLQCTINKFNYQHLEQMIEVAEQSGASSLTFHHLIFLKEESIIKQKEIDALLHCSSGDWEGFVFEPGVDPEVLYQKMRQIKGDRYKFNVDFYPNFSRNSLTEYYRNSCVVPMGFNNRCLSPWLVAYIFPDGQVRPCLNCSYSFGNIKNDKFMRLWNSESAMSFRKILEQRQIFPVCVHCTELYRY